MPRRDYHERKLGRHHRFRDISHIKLTDMVKSLRRRRLHKSPSHRSLVRSRNVLPPFAGRDSSPPRLPLLDFSTSSYFHASCYRSDATSIVSATEEDYSPGASISSSGLEDTPPSEQQSRRVSPRLVATFPTSPSVFQLRSASSQNYIVERLEHRLRRLSLGDASPDRAALPEISPKFPRDAPMEVCLDSKSASQRPTPDLETSPRRALPDRHGQTSKSSPCDQNLVPMIFITSVDAKHAKPLPPSTQRPSRTPFGPSNVTAHPTNAPSAKSGQITLFDDPFAIAPHASVRPADFNLAFRLPSFPIAGPSPTQRAPESPTPTCRGHFGDCRGDLWEILHPPLVAGAFTFPPFELPPLSLSTDLFGDVPSTPLSL